MTGFTRKYEHSRSIGRRDGDLWARNQNARFRQILLVGQIITSEIKIDLLFEVIMAQTNQIMSTERSTVFLHDGKERQLWSLVATGMKKNEIRIPDTFGVAGAVFKRQRYLIINNAYSDPRFRSEIDKKSGFRTRNLLCIPLKNRKGECIGSFQALNKTSGDFTNEDLSMLSSISNYVVIAIENARLYQELDSLHEAKKRVVDHLAHELKTPLAIISAVFKQFSKDMIKTDRLKLEKAISRGERGVQRLLDLQEKVNDIMSQKPVKQKQHIINIIEDAVNLVGEIGDSKSELYGDLVKKISDYLEAIYKIETISLEKIALDSFMNRVCETAEASIEHRDLTIARDFEKNLNLTMDPAILEKTCAGLLKNAIENTPDQGKIQFSLSSRNEGIEICVQDWGVGVTDENQKRIFSGFFHMQSSDLYTSKKPYDFNAGGSGADLLRIKVFSERFGFDLDFKSTRCRFIPEDSDVCKGRIDGCRFVKKPTDCFSSGGSVFRITFPEKPANGIKKPVWNQIFR